MKKRNKPVLLVTLLVIMLGVVMAMNYKPSPQDLAKQQQQQMQQQATGESRESTPDKKDLASAAKSAVGGPKASKATVPQEAMKGMPPSVEIPGGGQVSKPTPNDSNISGQWYQDEHRKAGL